MLADHANDVLQRQMGKKAKENCATLSRPYIPPTTTLPAPDRSQKTLCPSWTLCGCLAEPVGLVNDANIDLSQHVLYAC